MGLSHAALRIAYLKAIDNAIKQINSQSGNYLLNAIDTAENLIGGNIDSSVYGIIKKYALKPDSKWAKYAEKILRQTNPNVLKTHILNISYESGLNGLKTLKKTEKMCKFSLPYLIDIAVVNNEKTPVMPYEKIDETISQGKQLGIYFYILSGGDVFERKLDIMKLCRKHNDCTFIIETFGSGITDVFAKRLADAGNISININISENTEKTFNIMKILKNNGIIFGVVACYNINNYKNISDDCFLNKIIENGGKYIGFFRDNSAEKLNDTEKAEFYKKIKYIRSDENPILLLAFDFENDIKYIKDCFTDGRSCLYIDCKGFCKTDLYDEFSDINAFKIPLIKAISQLQKKN